MFPVRELRQRYSMSATRGIPVISGRCRLHSGEAPDPVESLSLVARPSRRPRSATMVYAVLDPEVDSDLSPMRVTRGRC